MGYVSLYLYAAYLNVLLLIIDRSFIHDKFYFAEKMINREHCEIKTTVIVSQSLVNKKFSSKLYGFVRHF